MAKKCIPTTLLNFQRGRRNNDGSAKFERQAKYKREKKLFSSLKEFSQKSNVEVFLIVANKGKQWKKRVGATPAHLSTKITKVAILFGYK